ncbi:MFS transporter [Bacillus sp. EKM104P]|uniref:MFS transporter n=1 Tax=Bacillus sp. EKM104P TaxID=2708091 RepID=UPI00142D2C36|nr:MFS transporter [Bacillus sp. EKM104P]
MSYIQHHTTAYRKVTLSFFVAGFNTFAILYCVQPLMSEFTKKFHITPTVASLSLSVTTMLLAFSMIVIGTLSEVWGRKGIMSISMIAASICCLMTAFSPNYHTLLILRALQGIALAGLPSIAMAYLGEEIESSSLGAAMGLYISGNAIGAVFGRVVSGILTDFWDWHMAIGGIGIISFIASLVFVRFLPPSGHFTPRELELKQLGVSLLSQLKDKQLLGLFIIGFLLLGSNVALFNYFTYVLSEAPYRLKSSVTSWIFIVMLVGTISSSFNGRLVDRYSYQRIISLNLILFMFGTVLTLCSSLSLKIIGVSIFIFGFFGAHSIASSWVGRKAKKNRAQASSLYLFFYYLGSSIGGTIGGVFWGLFGWNGVIGMILFMLILALAIRISKLEHIQTD